MTTDEFADDPGTIPAGSLEAAAAEDLGAEKEHYQPRLGEEDRWEPFTCRGCGKVESRHVTGDRPPRAWCSPACKAKTLRKQRGRVAERNNNAVAEALEPVLSRVDTSNTVRIVWTARLKRQLRGELRYVETGETRLGEGGQVLHRYQLVKPDGEIEWEGWPGHV